MLEIVTDQHAAPSPITQVDRVDSSFTAKELMENSSTDQKSFGPRTDQMQTEISRILQLQEADKQEEANRYLELNRAQMAEAE